jgi:DNA polymerase-3 subunit alpha
MKVLVKEGWTDRDTGKKGEPRLQFVEVKQLHVLETFARKLVVLLNTDLEADFIHKLSHLFKTIKEIIRFRLKSWNLENQADC